MIPLIVERARARSCSSEWVREEADDGARRGRASSVDYLVGTMIETPRAALVADEIAEVAEFFSFGTNDLTQMTFGFSPRRRRGPLHAASTSSTSCSPANPFETLDVEGVGQLVRMGVRAGPRDAARHQARHLRRARRRPGVGRVLPRGRPRLRVVLAVPRADRPPRRRARRARPRRPGLHRLIGRGYLGVRMTRPQARCAAASGAVGDASGARSGCLSVRRRARRHDRARSVADGARRHRRRRAAHRRRARRVGPPRKHPTSTLRKPGRRRRRRRSSVHMLGRDRRRHRLHRTPTARPARAPQRRHRRHRRRSRLPVVAPSISVQRGTSVARPPGTAGSTVSPRSVPSDHDGCWPTHGRPCAPRAREAFVGRAGAAPRGARGRARRVARAGRDPARRRRDAGPAEEPDPFRLCFERDLDRIKHSRPWRRLAGKCQVFIAPEDDHLRTRLTHAVEVAQVATGIARAANLCVPLVEAIALAHDCGHGPAGPRVGGGVLAVPARRLRPRRLRRRRHARAAQPLRRDARRRAQPLVAPARAVHARGRGGGVGRSHRLRVPRLRRRGARRDPRRPTTCPPRSRDVVGAGRSRADRRVRRARCSTPIDRTGTVGMTEPAATALAAFRAFNFERIYLRPAARRQAEQVDRPARRPRRPLRRRAAPHACRSRPAMRRRPRRRARPRPPRSRCATSAA